jgi:hypothetical protein
MNSEQEPSKNDHRYKIAMGLLCMMFILFVIGIPSREFTKNELPPNMPTPEGDTVKDSPESQALDEELLAPLKEMGTTLTPTTESLRALVEPQPVQLTEDQEYHLMVSNYDAYVRYKAQLENPERRKPSTPEQIVSERITPRLLEYLEGQKK